MVATDAITSRKLHMPVVYLSSIAFSFNLPRSTYMFCTAVHFCRDGNGLYLDGKFIYTILSLCTVLLTKRGKNKKMSCFLAITL